MIEVKKKAIYQIKFKFDRIQSNEIEGGGGGFGFRPEPNSEFELNMKLNWDFIFKLGLYETIVICSVIISNSKFQFC